VQDLEQRFNLSIGFRRDEESDLIQQPNWSLEGDGLAILAPEISLIPKASDNL
jgi:hypothetical protein